MQVMARAENTVFLRVEVKETNLEIFSVYAFAALQHPTRAKPRSEACDVERNEMYRILANSLEIVLANLDFPDVRFFLTTEVPRTRDVTSWDGRSAMV